MAEARQQAIAGRKGQTCAAHASQMILRHFNVRGITLKSNNSAGLPGLRNLQCHRAAMAGRYAESGFIPAHSAAASR
jgi:hypothetical protein